MTSLDMKKPGDRKLFYASQMGEAKEASEVFNVELSVTDIVLAPAEKMNPETLQMDRWIATTLILADGSCVRFGSRGVVKSLALYCDCFAPPPWNPPALFRLKSETVGAGHWYTLEALDMAPPPAVKNGKPK